jgi:hypothetical protein
MMSGLSYCALSVVRLRNKFSRRLVGIFLLRLRTARPQEKRRHCCFSPEHPFLCVKNRAPLFSAATANTMPASHRASSTLVAIGRSARAAAAFVLETRLLQQVLPVAALLAYGFLATSPRPRLSAVLNILS